MARVDISIRADLRLQPSPPSCADVSPTDASEPLLTPFSEFRDGFPPPPPPNFCHRIAGRGYFYFSDFSQWSRVGRGGIFNFYLRFRIGELGFCCRGIGRSRDGTICVEWNSFPSSNIIMLQRL